ncbi:MAG: CBS domain-containing protein [Candidatus Saccharimonadales bacterium]
MEWLVQFLSLGVALLIAFLKSAQFAPNHLSDFELERLAQQGDASAVAEAQRRQMLPMVDGLVQVKILVLSLLVVVLQVSVLDVWLALVVSLAYLLLAELLAARVWIARYAQRLAAQHEPRLLRLAAQGVVVLRLLTAPRRASTSASFLSKAEFKQLITADQSVLSQDEKTRLLSTLEFGTLKISDVMVPRDKVKTVGVGETVGPLLLDRLHKDGHNVFPVVKKDLDHIKGFLFMRDLVPLDSDLKEVKDAVRPSVYYLPEDAPLSALLAASLQTGRQLFIVVGDTGKTVGLITLQDALAKLMGEPLPKESPVATDPKKVK